MNTAVLLIVLMAASTQHVFADNSAQAPNDDHLFASAAGKYFSQALNVINPQVGKVADEAAVAYQSKCGVPATLSVVKEFTLSGEGKEAVRILESQRQQGDACRNDGKCDITFNHARYMTLIAGIVCYPPTTSTVKEMTSDDLSTLLRGLKEVSLAKRSNADINRYLAAHAEMAQRAYSHSQQASAQ